jgi:hypothetical protein
MPQQTTLEAVPAGQPALARIRILVFSDEPASWERLATTLRRSGAQILSAPPGGETINACRLFRPQLIVAVRVPYAECARLVQGLREAGVPGTAIAISPAGDSLAAGEVSDPRLLQEFEEELTGLLIRLVEGSRDSP